MTDRHTTIIPDLSYSELVCFSFVVAVLVVRLHRIVCHSSLPRLRFRSRPASLSCCIDIRVPYRSTNYASSTKVLGVLLSRLFSFKLFRHTTMVSLLPPVNVTGVCDRRRSRAARQVLTEQVVPLLEHWLEERGQDLPRASSPKKKATSRQPQSLAPTYLWDILKIAVVPGCPLSRDMYQVLEEQSLAAAPRSPNLAPRRTYSQWLYCGLCGKVFTSRYYLDRHQHLQHKSIDEGGACWDDVVCGALGGCDRVALDLEPHYGRGSGTAGPDATAVQRAWASRIQPCNEEHVQANMKPQCIQLMNDCFSDESLNRQLQETLCEPLSCHALLHRQEWMHRHSSKSLWQNQVHPDWSTVMLVVGLLGMYYLVNYVVMGERGSHGGKGHGGRRLLQKKERRSSWFWRRKQKNKAL